MKTPLVLSVENTFKRMLILPNTEKRLSNYKIIFFGPIRKLSSQCRKLERTPHLWYKDTEMIGFQLETDKTASPFWDLLSYEANLLSHSEETENSPVPMI